MQNLSIDLVMTTCNRHDCVKKLLDSLTCQNNNNFRLIAGLQAPDANMQRLVESYKNFFTIEIYTLPKCSLSNARNNLLKLITADIIALTDDDCWYPADFTGSLVNFFSRNQVEACVGVPAQGKAVNINKKLSRFSIFFNAPSWLIFFRREVLLSIGNFDEELGVGAATPWQSGEETDFMIRLMEKGNIILRTSNIKVMHPKPSCLFPQKWYDYGRGRMHVLKKHNFPFWFCLLNVIYPFFKYLTCSKQFKHCYWAMFKSRLHGLFLP